MPASVRTVMSALLADHSAERYGLQLIQHTGLPSGTIYPVLVRLERAGWVESRWEEIDPVAEGRPARRYYRLTGAGSTEARRKIALMHQQLTRSAGPIGEIREA